MHTGENGNSPVIEVDEPEDQQCGEIVYDASHIEVVDNFDIGEPIVPHEISSEEVSLWQGSSSNIGQYRTVGMNVVASAPLSTASHAIHRAKSSNIVFDSSEEPSTSYAHALTNNDDSVSRVFVSNDVRGQHLDWVLYSESALSFSAAAQVLASEGENLKPGQLCTSVPQEFTGVGSFVVSLRDMKNKFEITIDGLGSWGSPQGSSRFYRCPRNGRLIISNSSNYDLKVLCSRYTHPGTDSRGTFIKKVFTGMFSTGTHCSIALLSYDWIGTPHPVSVYPERFPNVGSLIERPFGSRAWEAPRADLQIDEGIAFENQPLFCRVAVDFESACNILLNTFEIAPSRICTELPRLFNSCGTFVVDLRNTRERSLTKDGREWNKPSGSSRFYRFLENGNLARIDGNGNFIASQLTLECDIQIIKKRYETLHSIGLCKKIYVVRGKLKDRVNGHLAVVTYFVQPNTQDTIVSDGRIVASTRDIDLSTVDMLTRNDDPAAEDSLIFVDTDRPRRSRLEIRRHLLEMKLLNQRRLVTLLDRAESLFQKVDQLDGQHLQNMLQTFRSLPSADPQHVNEEDDAGNVFVEDVASYNGHWTDNDL